MSEYIECGLRERHTNPDGSTRFFRSGYPCRLPAGHTGNCRSGDGEWVPADAIRVDPLPGERQTLRLIRGGGA